MVSCSDDDSYEYHYELLPIEEALVPDEFEYGKIYSTSVKYIVPDDCYINSDILYEYNDDARNVAVISLVIDSDDCETIARPAPQHEARERRCRGLPAAFQTGSMGRNALPVPSPAHL